MKHPEIARRWTRAYGIPKDLPAHVGTTPKERVVAALAKRRSHG
jgi:uncharacterized protein YmfQ (DUF2313 family)